MQDIRCSNRNSAFTLIELLLVCVMLSVVGLALYSVLNNGLMVWQRVNRPSQTEDLNIFFDKFTTDLKNCLQFSGIAFDGAEDHLDFAAIVNSQRLAARTVGKVMYACDKYKSVITRRQMDYSDIYADAGGGMRTEFGAGTKCRFWYYAYDAEKKQYGWRLQWAEAKLPLAVRIEMEIKDGPHNRAVTKTVTIPPSREF